MYVQYFCENLAFRTSNALQYQFAHVNCHQLFDLYHYEQAVNKYMIFSQMQRKQQKQGEAFLFVVDQVVNHTRRARLWKLNP